MTELRLDSVTKIYDNELSVYGRCGEIMMSARLPGGTQAIVGDSFAFKIEPSKLYIFDAKTEENLI